MANVLNLTLDRRGGTTVVYLGGTGVGEEGVGVGVFLTLSAIETVSVKSNFVQSDCL